MAKKCAWTAVEITQLNKMGRRAPATRVGLAVKRPVGAVKDRARDEGVPFPHDRVFIKAQRTIAYR